MKRLVLVAILVCGIIVTCISSIYRVGKIRERVFTYANSIFIAIELNNGREAYDETLRLVDYWREEAPVLARFVRHAHVDEITKAVAKLEPFARHGSYGDLGAELGVIVWITDDIWESELPKLGNVF